MLRHHFKRDGQPKKGYSTQAEALEVAERMNAGGPRRVRSYECDFCGAWHNGVRRGSGRKAGKLPPGKRVEAHHRKRPNGYDE